MLYLFVRFNPMYVLKLQISIKKLLIGFLLNVNKNYKHLVQEKAVNKPIFINDYEIPET